MLRRVQRRVERRKEEEELGITSEMKELYGGGGSETDSEESESSSEEEENEQEHRGSKGLKRMAHPDSSDDGEEDDKDDASLEAGAEEGQRRGDAKEDPEEDGTTDEEEVDFGGPIDVTVDGAMDQPIYLSATSRGKDGYLSRACVFCPTKELKNPKMVEEHLTSKPHRRRQKRYSDFLSASRDRRRKLPSDPRAVVLLMDEDLEQEQEEELDKAEQRRDEAREARREKIRAKIAAKKAAKEAWRALPEEERARCIAESRAKAKVDRADKASVGGEKGGKKTVKKGNARKNGDNGVATTIKGPSPAAKKKRKMATSTTKSD